MLIRPRLTGEEEVSIKVSALKDVIAATSSMDEADEDSRHAGGCGRNCFRSCCLPVSTGDELIEEDEEGVKSMHSQSEEDEDRIGRRGAGSVSWLICRDWWVWGVEEEFCYPNKANDMPF
ncbi:Hypothetical predicted protein [Olea europaea subsp. europaea]|uniref:Uncharacterized protein n=1 Tax=Olea europaea subsp. europaea TaxID=158383 RepID=A0A8S0PL05_OLEEU|nr:Hypothetical predicted protein [Olea europaea subsp. europaea]